MDRPGSQGGRSAVPGCRRAAEHDLRHRGAASVMQPCPPDRARRATARAAPAGQSVQLSCQQTCIACFTYRPTATCAEADPRSAAGRPARRAAALALALRALRASSRPSRRCSREQRTRPAPCRSRCHPRCRSQVPRETVHHPARVLVRVLVPCRHRRRRRPSFRQVRRCPGSRRWPRSPCRRCTRREGPRRAARRVPRPCSCARDTRPTWGSSAPASAKAEAPLGPSTRCCRPAGRRKTPPARCAPSARQRHGRGDARRAFSVTSV
jgi:hypothetical protein